jgi:hypothetical protein
VAGRDPLPAAQHDLGAATVADDRLDLHPGPQPHPGPARGAGQLLGETAHPADRHVPAPEPVADHVVQEAAVLAQRRVVRRGEGPDQRVGEQHAADLVVADPGGQGLGQRGLEQCLADIGIDAAQELLARKQRLGQGRRERAGGSGRELAPGAHLRLRERGGLEPLACAQLDAQAELPP